MSEEDLCSVCLDNYNINKEKRKIGCGHKFHKDCLDKWFVNNSTCPMCRILIDKNDNVVNLEKSLDLWSWILHMRNKCLTIQDILEMKKGDTIKLLCLDRNVGDFADNYELSAEKASEFFKDNYIITYRHNKDLQGEWFFHNHLHDDGFDNFEFHIEYKTGCWYPLTEGRLPDTDPQGFSDINKNTKKDWKEYPTDTHIGWRGPMVRWDIVENDDTPSVYCK